MTHQDLDAELSPATAAGTPAARPQWITPAITSFAPVSDAQGTQTEPGDGFSELSP